MGSRYVYISGRWVWMMRVNEDECIGCGACAAVCPDGIEMKDRKAVIKDDSVKCLEEVVGICPVGAIK